MLQPGDIILHLCTKNLDDMIYSSCDIECDRLKLVIMSHFLAFLRSPPPWRYHHFSHLYQKPQSHEVQFPGYGARLTKNFVLLGHFLPF